MNTIFRITGAVNKVHPANPADCLEEIRGLLDDLSLLQSDIIVLPSFALCSPSCGNLFGNAGLLEQCEQALEELRRSTRNVPSCILVGLVIGDYGKPVSVIALLHNGKLLGLVPDLSASASLSAAGGSQRLLPADTVFGSGGLRFRVLGCGLPDLALQASAAVQSGCDLIILPAYSPVYAGMAEQVSQSAKQLSLAAGCAVAVINGGVGDTSAPYSYSGFVGIYECGETMAFRIGGYDSFFCSADLELDIIRPSKKALANPTPFYTAKPGAPRAELLRRVDACPWLPAEGRERYLDELFSLQVRSLATRMENIGITKLLVGVSGGLDSTAALLVSAAAMDVLELPRKNILALTMPGFGTSDRTYFNALSLPRSLEASCRDIPIRQAVQMHLEDIGHAGKKDTAYENAQARERTQILLDMANAVSGLVVGTGDLSEAALGFCTFGGDHMANYNVNICIPKSVLRHLVKHLADTDRIAGVSHILMDILDTPISPELLPPSVTGEIEQKTEEILGPYELHDFFLYYFIKYGMRPSKLFFYASIAFSGKLEPQFIRDKLALFLKRFCAGQFKRSSAPDCAVITEVNLCAANHYIPSDLDPSALLRELDEIDI